MRQRHLSWLTQTSLAQAEVVHWQLSPAALVEAALRRQEGHLSGEGALVCHTGAFTGRSPRDRFIVRDGTTEDVVWWGDVNQPFAPERFDALYAKLAQSLQGQEVYVRDAYACAVPAYRLPIRVVNTVAWHNLFCHNMFLRPSVAELDDFRPAWTILNVPSFQADPSEDGTRQANFTIINFMRRIILIGGTGYAGEMKKGIFTVLNCLLPVQHQVLPMHCAANVGPEDDTAIFFGLSGTGKTTLSADPGRRLIGDDEHGWYDEGVFNFEGGCYAKTIDLSPAKEPKIFEAIRFGAILENVCMDAETRAVDYADAALTENTRCAYPITHVADAVTPSVGSAPRHIFFLTCDAYGVLPPIARLNKAQAMYHFMAGYTAKVAGTEADITTPEATFSACFGAAFLPLHPTHYAAMLGQRIEDQQVAVWLVNTGWIGGPCGVGQRMDLVHTRALIAAALSDALAAVPYTKDTIFGLAIPEQCPGVPPTLLNPARMWADEAAYGAQAQQLAAMFTMHFRQYQDLATPALLAGGPLASGV